MTRDLAVGVRDAHSPTTRAARRSDEPGRAVPITLDGRGWVCALTLTLVAFAVYLALGLRLGRGDFFAADDFAFDQDVYTFANALFGGGDFILRHPFMLIWRGVSQGLLFLGIPVAVARALLLAAMGALTVLFAFLFMMRLGIALLEAGLLALFLACTSTLLFNGIVIDSYLFAGQGLAILYFVFLRDLDHPNEHPIQRRVLAAYLFGMTITNLVQAALAEAILWLGVLSWRAYLGKLIAFGAVVGILIAIGVLVCVPYEMFSVHGIKLYYWNSLSTGVAKGGELVSLPTLLTTLFGYGFVAPEFTAVPVPNGEPTMLDLRAFRMTIPGAAALTLWLLLLACGIVAAARDRANRKLSGFLVAVVILNVILSYQVQYRLSVYLYSAHMQLAILALAAFAVRDFSRSTGLARALPAAGLAGLVALTGYNNLQRAVELVTAIG